MTSTNVAPRTSVRPSGHIVAKPKNISVTLLPQRFEPLVSVWLAGDFEKLRKTAADLGMTPDCAGGYYGTLPGNEAGVVAIIRALRRNRDARKAEINEIERILLAGVREIATPDLNQAFVDPFDEIDEIGDPFVVDLSDLSDDNFREESIMTVTITVYSTPTCVQCRATERHVDARGIEVVHIDLSVNPELIESFKERGFVQAPIVIVTDENGTEIDAWTGFDPDRLNKHAALIAA